MNRDLYKKSETRFPPQQCFKYICKISSGVLHNERDIDFQKIKVKKLFVRYNLHYVPELFHIICTNI